MLIKYSGNVRLQTLILFIVYLCKFTTYIYIYTHTYKHGIPPEAGNHKMQFSLSTWLTKKQQCKVNYHIKSLTQASSKDTHNRPTTDALKKVNNK